MGFWSSLFGFGDSKPATQVVQQVSKFPEELSPYIKEILGEAQTLYGAQKEEGYQPYTGETIAPLTPEELQAQEGLKGLVGTAQPYLKEALETYRTGAEKFTPEAAQEYMSPYQRAVTDIEKREAQKVFERDVMPRFEKQAVQAGGMSGLGSRAAIQAGQLGQAQMQQMGDIEAKGLQKSYMDAQKLFAEQKARERTAAGDIGRTGTGLYQAGLADQGLLQSIGQQKRELGQTALDEAYYKFLKKQAYPQDIISQYSGTVYGAPNIGPSKTITSTGTPYQPSTGQTLLGLGLTGLNIYGMGGGFGGDWTGKQFQKNVWGKKGGSIGGLSGLPVVRRKSGDQVLGIFSKEDYDEDSSPHSLSVNQPLSVNQQSMWPQADISLEEFQRRRPYLDPNVVSKILQKQATRVSDERTRQATERKALTDPLIQSLGGSRGAGSAARKFGALQEGISNMMNNPAGALVGLVSASGPALSEIGQITREDAEFEADLAVKIFGVQKADLTEGHKAALQSIIEDGNIQTTLLELPGKAHKEYLDELVKISTIAMNKAKLLAAGKDKGKLSATVDGRLASMAAGAFGFQAKLSDDGKTLQIMDGNTFVSAGDNKKVTGKIVKLLKVYGRNRKLGKDEATAIADSFTEVFPDKPVPPEVEEEENKPEPTEKLTPNVQSFKPNARKKSQY